MRVGLAAVLAFSLVGSACSAPMSVREQRAQALADLADPGAREAALQTLARFALTHDGDHPKAALYLAERSAPAGPEAWVLTAITRAGEGDLAGEIDAWIQAGEAGGPVICALAAVRLLRVADYIPAGEATRRALALAERIDGQEVLEAAALRLALTRSRAPQRDLRLTVLPEPWPWSAFVDKRGVPDGPTRPGRAVDNKVFLGNTLSALVRVEFEVPARARGTWIRVSSREAWRVHSGERLLLEHDPIRAFPPRAAAAWLPPSSEPRRIRIELFVQQTSAWMGLELAEGSRASSALADSSAPWIARLLRLELRALRGDRDGAKAQLARLREVAPRLVEAELLTLTLAHGSRESLAALFTTGHAAVLREIAGRSFHDGRESEALKLTDRLALLADPRADLLRFRIFQGVGWTELANAAIDRAQTRFPGACEPAMEAFQYRWGRLKLRGYQAALDALPSGCAELNPRVMANFAAETGHLRTAEQLLAADAGSRREPTLHGVMRARLLERQGDHAAALELTRKEAASAPDAEPHFRYGDLNASRGQPQQARTAWDRGARVGDGGLEVRLKLMAVEHARAWKRFAPNVAELFDNPPPQSFTAGHSAVLLLDHQTALRFGDGSAIRYTHQILRLDTPGSVADLGEVELPVDAVVLISATRKADGRTLEPEDIAQKETVSFPELEVGDAIELAYLTGVAAEPSLAGWLDDSFYFQLFEVPTWRSEYVVLLQDGVKASYEATSDLAEPEVLKAPGFHGWRWLGGPRPAAKPEPMAVSPFDELPQVRVWSGIGWPELLSQVRERLLGLLTPSQRMIALARELEQPDAGPWGHASAIYHFVMGGITEADDQFLGVPAARAVAEGRGERAVTLLGMLRAAGFEADLAMVDPVHREHKPRKAPEVRDYSYLLIRVKHPESGDLIWLDPTFQGAPFGFLSPTVRGRPAWLVRPEGVAAARTRTPREQPSDGRRVVRVALTMRTSGAMAGTWHEDAGGMDGVVYRDNLRRMPESERGGAVAELTQELLPGVQAGATRIDGLEESEFPVTIHHELAQRAPGAGPPKSLRLALLPTYAALRWVQTAERKTPLYVDRAENLDLEVSLLLPPNVTAGALPEPTVHRSRFGTYERTVTQEKQHIVIRKRIRLLPQIVPPHGYLLFRKFCRIVDEGDRLELTFTKR